MNETKLTKYGEIWADDPCYEKEYKAQQDFHDLVSNANKLYDQALKHEDPDLIVLAKVNKQLAFDLANYFNWCRT